MQEMIPFYKTIAMPLPEEMSAWPLGMNYLQPYGLGSQDYFGVKQWNDMEYFQKRFPLRVRKYTVYIAQVVDKLDYKGSMIYDEIPDELRIRNLSDSIAHNYEEEVPLPEEEKELLYVLLCYEIMKRRQRGPHRIPML